MSTSLRNAVLSLPLLVLVAACGNTPGERAITGGAIGAAGGAVVGGATGVGVLPGAIIGGLGGAAIGVVTGPGYCDRNNYNENCR